MISLESFGDLTAMPAGNFAPKPTSLTEGQIEALVPLWESLDGLTKIGIWDCTIGRFTADRSKAAEICHILSGTASVVNADGGGKRDIGAGDMLILPIGWTGSRCCWLHFSRANRFFLLFSTAFSNVGSRFPR